MAIRRMLSKKIIGTDAFMEMPLSTQALYMHLVMNADDDGFVSNPKTIMRSVGCNVDDKRVLETKRFILNFDSGVIVIKHWLVHNLIRSDRYNETTYLREKSMLAKKDNNIYTFIEPLNNDVIPLDNQMAPQVSIGKVSIGKSSKGKISKEKKEDIYFDNTELDNLFKDFLKQRKSPKVKNTQRAVALLLNKLEPYTNEIRTEMINNSLVGGWTSVFPISENKFNNKGVVNKNRLPVDIEEPEWLTEHIKRVKES
jgi:hypothetical protein